MQTSRTVLIAMASLTAFALVGCASSKPMIDYSSYRGHMPRSVLVIPPINDSVDVNAPYIFLSTVTRPLAEAGYYVFPVAVVDNFMKENGLPTPDEMNAVPLDKIAKIIGADAVLYVHIEEWGQKYIVLSSTTVVKVRARMVDVKTGTTLWEGTARVAEGSGDGGGGLAGMLLAAVIDQIVDSATDRTHGLSAVANANLILNADSGLLLGPYNPGYETDARGR